MSWDGKIWPAYVVTSPPEKRRKIRHDEYSDGAETQMTVPILFFNDPESPIVFADSDSLCAFPNDRFWVPHMRKRSELEIKNKGWEKPSRKLWAQWEKACQDALDSCTPVEGS